MDREEPTVKWDVDDWRRWATPAQLASDEARDEAPVQGTLL